MSTWAQGNWGIFTIYGHYIDQVIKPVDYLIVKGIFTVITLTKLQVIKMFLALMTTKYNCDII